MRVETKVDGPPVAAATGPAQPEARPERLAVIRGDRLVLPAGPDIEAYNQRVQSDYGDEAVEISVVPPDILQIGKIPRAIGRITSRKLINLAACYPGQTVGREEMIRHRVFTNRNGVLLMRHVRIACEGLNPVVMPDGQPLIGVTGLKSDSLEVRLDPRVVLVATAPSTEPAHTWPEPTERQASSPYGQNISYQEYFQSPGETTTAEKPAKPWEAYDKRYITSATRFMEELQGFYLEGTAMPVFDRLPSNIEVVKSAAWQAAGVFFGRSQTIKDPEIAQRVNAYFRYLDAVEALTKLNQRRRLSQTAARPTGRRMMPVDDFIERVDRARE